MKTYTLYKSKDGVYEIGGQEKKLLPLILLILTLVLGIYLLGVSGILLAVISIWCAYQWYLFRQFAKRGVKSWFSANNY